MIELDHVSRLYTMGEEPLRALNDVSEVIEAGEYVAVMGPSGSGKSTLLNLLGCLDRPSQGSYHLDGQDVGALSEDEISEIRRHKIGFVFQTFHLVPRLSAAENVAFPMVFAGVPRGERSERVATARGTVVMAPETFALIRDGGVKKGDVLSVARKQVFANGPSPCLGRRGLSYFASVAVRIAMALQTPRRERSYYRLRGGPVHDPDFCASQLATVFSLRVFTAPRAVSFLA